MWNTLDIEIHDIERQEQELMHNGIPPLRGYPVDPEIRRLVLRRKRDRALYRRWRRSRRRSRGWLIRRRPECCPGH